MIGATRVESGLTVRAGAVAAQVAGDAEGVAAAAAVDGLGLKFSFGPNLGGVAHRFVVAANAGVELAAALVPDGDNVALGMVVGALGALVDLSAVDSDGLTWLRH